MKNTDLYLKPGTYIKASTTTGDVSGISLENFVVSVLNNPTCCPKPPGSPDGMLMTALALYPTLQTVTDFLGNSSAIQLSTLRLGIRSDSSVTTQTSSVIQATTTNANLVIAPNGTGALVARIPDGTAVGGNARGNNSVDLQIYQSTTGVASGDISVCGGGRANTASNNYSVVSGGYSNISSGQFSYVGAGTSNTASSNYSTVSGGQSNTASTGINATVVGGQGNTASGLYSVAGGKDSNASGNSSIAIGRQANASGNNSVALGGDAGGGSGSSAIGSRSFAVGYGAYASGSNSIALGSFPCNATNENSVAIGTGSASRSYGKFAYANGQNGQIANCVLKRSSVLLNAAATAALYSDNSSINYIYCNSAFDAKISITCTWIATVVTVGSGALSVGDTITGKDFFFVKSIAGISSISTINRISTVNDASMVTATMSYTSSHSGSTGTLLTSFVAPTTANGTTFQIVAKLETVEIGQN
jgi:hypothetical protein